MKGLKQYWKEISAIGRSPKLLIPVIGIAMIPVMYSGMFLGAFWNPYGNLDKLPVAIVNSDRGTTYEGKEMRIGQDFVDELKENKTFDFRFVGRADAEEGLKNNDYYMAIEIPAGFSESAATLTTDKPSPAQLVFMPNESSNFLASQIGNNAVEKMKTELGREVTKAYASAMFDQIRELADGLGQASDGAGEIASGTGDARDGARKLEENLNKLATGSASLKDGIAKLMAGGADLEKGASGLKQGAGGLAGGLKKLGEAGGRLESGAAQAKDGAAGLAAGLAQSAAGAEKLDAGAGQVAGGLEQYAQAHPELAEDEAFRKLVAASKEVAAGAEAANQGQRQLAAGADKLSAGTAGLEDGLKSFVAKLGEAGQGGAALEQGAGRLSEGASALKGGLGSLSGGIDRFADGSAKLDDGAREMAEGLVKLTDGTGELSGKLTEAAQKTSGIKDGDDVVDMFASPVELDVVKTNAVPNYGTGLAPYFISMGLYVGALLLTVVYQAKEPIGRPSGGWSWFVSKLLTMTTIGIVQALVADAILLYGVGLEVRSVPLFVLLSVATSVTFMAIIQFLAASMQNPGRFLAIILLIFQLTSSGGTFPLEMVPGWLQNVGAWLPMTHTIAAFKAVVSSGDYDVLRRNVGWLAIYFAAFAALSLAYYLMAYRKEYKKNRTPSRGTGPEVTA